MQIILIGPGGAGKTTSGKIVAERLGYKFIDLDQLYFSKGWDISNDIDEHGYKHYAFKNIELYKEVLASNAESSVVVLSSGFMTYDESIHSEIKELQDDISSRRNSVMLMPSANKAECVEIIVERQMKRTFEDRCEAKERSVIEQRFDTYRNLGRVQLFTSESPRSIAGQIMESVKSL